jgi:hypothetical protein
MAFPLEAMMTPPKQTIVTETVDVIQNCRLFKTSFGDCQLFVTRMCVAKWFDEELCRGTVVDVTVDDNDNDNANDNHTCICHRTPIVDCHRTIFICKCLTAQLF